MTKRKWLLYTTAALAVIFIAGFMSYLHFAPVGKVILIRTTSGGLCASANGHGQECSGETKLYSNGHFGDTYVSHDRVRQLEQLIASTDFSQYTAKDPQEQHCNSFVDGSDVGYYFPTKTGNTHFTDCQLNIPDNDPLFSFLDTLN